MFRNLVLLLALFSLLAPCALAQGMDTRASKDDWEEINFEFNSAVLSDGYPSLLRLAELLSRNPGYRVRVEGHTDGIGSARYNDKLGQARANTVRDFLVKYGAKADQIQTSTRGKSQPEVPGEKRRYSKTDVARWMNRRVVLTVTDDQGRTVSAGSVGDAIRAMDPNKAAACCEEILKRLDRLDEIAKMLRDLADQNAGLRKELDNLRTQQSALQSQVNALPKPLSEEQTASVVDTRLEKFRDPRFSLLGINVGSDNERNLTFTGRGRFFAPFKERFAIQAQGEYLYFKNMKEGQFDLGLVNRIGNFQAGLFSSFKHVSLSGMQNGATLGQAALSLDYIFRIGRLGVFGTKAFMNDAVVNRANATFTSGTNADGTARMIVAPNLFTETYLRVIDQVGVSTALGLWGSNYLEANVGYLKSYAHADRPGGTLRFVFPFADRLAFTIEGGMNETLLARHNWGRATVGLQFGNFVRPREMQAMNHPVPVDVPRVRWEMLTRNVRTGASPPIADAGPDQIGVPAGSITLNGSNSYDPNGERLTYAWTQEGGPSVSVSGMNQATATFTAAQNQTYVFRLTVTNQSGLSSSARVRISTAADQQVQILFFVANPPVINPGQASQLSWRVLNATSVSIETIGTVAAQGTSSVSPTQTTTYRLTARNGNSEENATVTVQVNAGQTRVFGCFASPVTINQGEAATIAFQTENATAVTVSPTVPGSIPAAGGSFVVNPTQTTTYTLTATGQGNQTGTCTVTVTVNTQPNMPPRIVRFTANPTTINAGQSSTLDWQVENATSVTIDNGVGTVEATGTRAVSPAQTTTYTLTATGPTGTSTATVTINVNQANLAPVITSFTANPSPSPAPGTPVTLTCLANNATSFVISGGGQSIPSRTVTFSPQQTTVYTCTATGPGGTATRELTLNVTPTDPGGNGGEPGPPPVVVISGGPVIETVVRPNVLDASGSTSPTGNTPLTYLWTSADGRSSITNATSPRPTVYLGNLYGDYVFNVAVTDSRGQTTNGQVTVRLVVTRVP